MKINRTAALSIVAVAVVGSMVLVGCGEKSGSGGAMEKTGAAMDNAAEKAVEAANAAADKTVEAAKGAAAATKDATERVVEKTGEAMEEAGANMKK